MSSGRLWDGLSSFRFVDSVLCGLMKNWLKDNGFDRLKNKCGIGINTN